MFYTLTPYRHGIYTLDAAYERPLMTSIHLVVHQGRVILVDAGINASLPSLRRALAQLGLSFSAVDYLLLTHVHLDHAGGAGLILQHCPNAQVVVHGRGMRHLADPSKLIAGTLAVYGESATKRLYGEVVPIPMERMIEAKEGLQINWPNRPFTIMETPGHAKHHVCFFDEVASAVFTGDTMGISYRDMDEPQEDLDSEATADMALPRQFIVVTTTPVHFDPSAFKDSLHRIVARQPEVAYLTHFGELRDLPKMAQILSRQIDDFVVMALRHRHAGDARQQLIADDMRQWVLSEAKRFGSRKSDEEIINLWNSDIELDTQGLVVWLDGLKS